MIRPVTINDAARIAEIYNYYVADTIITFEEDPVDASEYASRIEAIQARELPSIVWESDGVVSGYAYACPWRTRIAYRFTVESAIYVARDQLGKGIGRQLYAALIDDLRSRNFNSVMGLISLPNPESIKLHERFGFKKVGEHAQVGWKFDRWIDVGVWQLMLADPKVQV